MTPTEIEAALNAYRAGQSEVIRQMASERGLDRDNLTPQQYRELVTEEAEWSEQFSASPHATEEEKAIDLRYAAALRELAARF